MPEPAAPKPAGGFLHQVPWGVWVALAYGAYRLYRAYQQRQAQAAADQALADALSQPSIVTEAAAPYGLGGGGPTSLGAAAVVPGANGGVATSPLGGGNAIQPSQVGRGLQPSRVAGISTAPSTSATASGIPAGTPSIFHFTDGGVPIFSAGPAQPPPPTPAGQPYPTFIGPGGVPAGGGAPSQQTYYWNPKLNTYQATPYAA